MIPDPGVKRNGIVYYTYRKVAFAHKAVWQHIKFAAGKGYYLVGKRPAPKPAPPAQPITMYDSIDVSQIPADAAAVAGYVGGHWPTFTELIKRFPKAHKLSIAVASYQDAECLDIEPGDSTPDLAPRWVKRQLARGVKRPVVYCSVSTAPEVQAKLKAAGIDRSQYRLWTAHYTMKPHRCSSACGFGFKDVADATQYTSRAMGRTLDASVCSPTFFSTDV